jgi:hypothetical protein
MNKNILKTTILFIAAGILLAVSVTVGAGYGISYGRRQQLAESTDAQTTKHYENKRLGFMLVYPASLNDIQETSDEVVFHIKDAQDITGFGVFADKTSFTSTKAWLEAQPKGSAASAGYEPLLWLDGTDGGGSGKMLVVKYVVVDHDGRTPIYGKQVQMVAVQNGILYEIPVYGESPVSFAPSVYAEIISIINSFQVLTP